MIAVIDVLNSILGGRPEAAKMLLGSVRTWAYGGEAFGGAMTCEVFARQPSQFSATPHVVQTDRGMALFDAADGDGSLAIFADLYNGKIGRLWRLGGGTRDATAEAGLFVAADHVMSQIRSDVAFQCDDHPDLNPDAASSLLRVASETAHLDRDGENDVVEGRAFVVRAFSEGDRAAALFFIEQARGEDKRQRRRFYAAAAFRFSSAGLTHQHSVIDRPSETDPRFRL